MSRSKLWVQLGCIIDLSSPSAHRSPRLCSGTMLRVPGHSQKMIQRTYFDAMLCQRHNRRSRQTNGCSHAKGIIAHLVLCREDEETALERRPAGSASGSIRDLPKLISGCAVKDGHKALVVPPDRRDLQARCVALRECIGWSVHAHDDFAGASPCRSIEASTRRPASSRTAKAWDRGGATPRVAGAAGRCHAESEESQEGRSRHSEAESVRRARGQLRTRCTQALGNQSAGWEIRAYLCREQHSILPLL